MTKTEIDGYLAKHSIDPDLVHNLAVGKTMNLWGIGPDGITKNPVDVRASGKTVYGQKVCLVRRNGQDDFEVLNDYGTV